MRQVLKKPKPDDALLSDPETRCAYCGEAVDLVAAAMCQYGPPARSAHAS
jgi:hypothetical protein